MLIRGTFSAIIINLTLIHAKFDAKLIKSYVERKFIQRADFYGCSSKSEMVKIAEEANISAKIIIFEGNLTDFKLNAPKTDINAVFIDGNCPGMNNLLDSIVTSNYCTTIRLCLVFYSNLSENFDRFVNANYKNLKLNVNADLKIANLRSPHDIFNRTYNIYDVYKVYSKYNTPLIVKHVGIWSAERKFNFISRQPDTFYAKRRNWNGVVLKSTIVLLKPFQGALEVYIRSDEHPEINHFHRLSCLFMMYIADYYNFTLKVSKSDTWGYLLPNGSYDGIMGGFQSETIDFGCSPMMLRKERFGLLDYGAPVWKLQSSFFFRPPSAKASFEVFFTPLDALVWYYIILCLGIIILAMKCVLYCEFNRRLQQDIDESWSAIILFLVGAICQQGASLVPVFISGRILTLFVFFFTVLIYQFYSASLVSSLLLQAPTNIKNIYDLADSDLKIGSENPLHATKLFDYIDNDIKLRQLQRKLFPNTPFFLPPEEGLKLVERGDYAFNLELATAYSLIQQNFQSQAICELEKVVFFSTSLYTNHLKGKKLRDAFDIILQKMSERGIMHRMQLKYNVREPKCIKDLAAASAVGLEQFYPALVIWSVGIWSSIIALIFECVSDKLARRYVNKPKHAQDSKLYPFVN